MIMHIPYEKFGPLGQKKFLDGTLNKLSIDYMYNAIMSWDGDQDFEVFNFGDICRMTNCCSKYKIYKTGFGITLEIKF